MQEITHSPRNINNFQHQLHSSTIKQTQNINQNINNCNLIHFLQQSKKSQNYGSEQANYEKAPIFQLLQQQSNIADPIEVLNVCTICSKKFLKHAHLIRHINERHQNTRSFNCKEPNCGKSFKRDSHLRRHMISHTHQKSYKCQKCIMAFGYKHHLDRHVKAVHEKQLLRCQSCSLSFIKKKAFIRHLQKIHPNSQQTQKTSESNTETILTTTSKGQFILKQKFKSLKSKNIKKSSGKNRKTLEKGTKKCQVNARKTSQLKSQIQYSLFHNESFDIRKPNHENENIKILQGSCLSKQIEEQRIEDNIRSEETNQKIFFKKSQENQQQLLFRCIHSDCVSAFTKMHELMRHLNQRHS